MPDKKRKRGAVPPSIRVYQNMNDKPIFDAIKRDAKKYGISISSLAVMAMEAGLGVVEHHYDELQKAIRERPPIKK